MAEGKDIVIYVRVRELGIIPWKMAGKMLVLSHGGFSGLYTRCQEATGSGTWGGRLCELAPRDSKYDISDLLHHERPPIVRRLNQIQVTFFICVVHLLETYRKHF